MLAGAKKNNNNNNNIQYSDFPRHPALGRLTIPALVFSFKSYSNPPNPYYRPRVHRNNNLRPSTAAGFKAIMLNHLKMTLTIVTKEAELLSIALTLIFHCTVSSVL